MTNEETPGWALAPPDVGYHHFSGTFLADCGKVGSEFPRCARVPPGKPWCVECGNAVTRAKLAPALGGGKS